MPVKLSHELHTFSSLFCLQRCIICLFNDGILMFLGMLFFAFLHLTAKFLMDTKLLSVKVCCVFSMK